MPRTQKPDRTETPKSVRTALAQATALFAVFSIAGPAVADPDPPAQTGATADFTGDQHLGINRTDTVAAPFAGPEQFPFTINVHNLTSTIAPASGLDGIHFEFEGPSEFGPPMTLTTDSSVNIEVSGAQGIFVRGRGANDLFFAAGPAITVDSAANVTLHTGEADQSRAVLQGREGQRDAYLTNVQNAQLALAALAGDDTSPEAQTALNLMNCTLNNTIIFGTCFTFPINSQTFIPLLYDFLYTQQGQYDFLNSPPSPQETISIDAFQSASELGALVVLDFGGYGGQPGIPGVINVTNRGQLTTDGANGAGILVQSIGVPDRASSNGGDITVTNYGTIITSGATSPAIFARSNGSISDSGGNGGQVNVYGDGTLTTQGAYAYGVYAISNGGDGANNQGHGGTGGGVTVDYAGDVTTHGNYAAGLAGTSVGGAGPKGKDADLGVGGSNQQANPGGVAGDGGDVSVTLDEGGSITTFGIHASGIAVLSQGGSGGRGGSGNISHDGASGGAGGDGGAATAINLGAIITHGNDSYGIIAQSLAGNGGAGGDDSGLFFDYGGAGGAAGGGATVLVQNEGTIITSGARAYGVLAQSIGGRGGAGGDATDVFGAHAGHGGTAATAACQDDGDCPNGGLVTVDNYGVIHTTGEAAYAVLAQSIGGGGGQGGDGSGWINIAGGEGGDAGRGDTVRVSNYDGAAIVASGNRSAGIVAQSIGGGGGNGGDANSAGPYAAVAIGGNAGAGGAGYDVHVVNDGDITVSGDRSNAIIGQSIGGGGGIGGSASAFSVSGLAAASISIGGHGGSGGSADFVEITNGGGIETHGDFSNGIFAQSIGGGGGLGGAAYAFSASVAVEDFSLSASIAVGGTGGDGGDGGEVHITNDGFITTYDFNSFGILAQSIGGGGGAGGDSMALAISANGGEGASFDLAIAVGGSGGIGADAGHLVTVDNNGSIFTFGDGSTGIIAQSIGGGGGNGGDASTTTAAFSGGESSSVELNIAIGGGAGDGGDGGQVVVNNTGSIVTLGWMANGITAQSVGGGGGTGGAGEQSDLFEDIDLPTEPPDFEGDDSDGRRQQVRDQYGQLQNDARGAQHGGHGRGGRGGNSQSVSIDLGISIGGNGGAGGDADMVTVHNDGRIITAGFLSMGVFAQSVGGGGGAGGGGTGSADGDIGLGAGIGGQGAVAGNGGEVWVYNTGVISTLQALSFGIFAQSIGGGGGLAGVGSGEGDPQSGLNFSLGMGQGGGDGGYGDLVHVEQTGDIYTFGLAGFGVFAQSIGGGGGVGGSAQEGSMLSVALGGNGGGANNGGEVYVHLDGNIATEGNYAIGIVAQSVGGGGGLAGGVETRTFTYGVDSFGLLNIDTGMTVSVANFGVGGGGGHGGDGGAVTVISDGAISTFGHDAHGIFAQSIGGGGGAGGSGGSTFPLAVGLAGSNGDAGAAGAITIEHTGDIHTYGADSTGIYAQSMAGGHSGRGGDITITLHDSDIVGGSGDAGVGVFVSGGAANVIDNFGGSISALSGIAIATTDGDDTVHNRSGGLIVGNVGLGDGLNAFLNDAGARFDSGAGVYIGAGGTLTNAGQVSPFAAEHAGQTTLVGNYVQTSTGSLFVDVNLNGGPSDLLIVQGNASLAGVVTPLFDHAVNLTPNTFVTVLTANALVDNGIHADGDTLVVDYASRIVGNTLQVGVAGINFVIDGLTPSEKALAGHFQDIWSGGGTDGLNPVTDFLASQTDPGAYADMLDRLNPHGAFTQGAQPITLSQTMLSGMMSCPGSAGAADFHEHACSWARVSQIIANQDVTTNAPAYENRGTLLQGGAQAEFATDWFAGFSVGFGRNRFDSDGFAQGDADVYGIGASLKHEIGDLLLAGGVQYARVSADRTRLTGFPTIVEATSSSDTDIFALRLRAAYAARFGDYYLRPAIDVDSYDIRTGAFSETGAGALDLVVSKSSQTFTSGGFAVEAGANFVQSDGRVVHPYVLAGLTTLSDDSFDMEAHFEGDPLGTPNVAISSAIPDNLVRTQIGFETLFAHGAFRLEYEERNGDGYRDFSFAAKLRMNF